MKRALLIAAGLFVLLVGALMVVPGFIGWDAWREAAESRIKTATGFDAHIDGGISLRLVPSPSLSVADVRIGHPGAEDPIVSFDRAAIHVRFMPLLQGRIEVDSITLLRPRIHILTLADGQNSWMTPELSLLFKGNAPAAPDAPAQKSLSDMVSLDHVGIEDGAFRYKNLQTGTEILVDSIDATLKAESLSGPVSVDGRFSTRGLDVQARGKTGRLDDMKAVPLDFELTLPKEQITLRYAGLVALSTPVSFQGETGVSLSDPARTLQTLTGSAPQIAALKKSLEAKGLLTVAEGTLAWKDLGVSLGDMGFSGSIDARRMDGTNPGLIADFKATTPIDLDALIPASSGKTQESQGFLPAAPPLPDAFRGQIKLSAARATYGGQPIKGLTIMASRQDKAPTFAIEAAEIPGKTSLKAHGAWSEDPTAPALDLTVDAKAGYLPETLKFLLGSKATASPLSSAFETGAAKLSARLTPTRLSLADSTLTLNDLTAAIKGFYALPAEGTDRPAASLTLNAAVVDIDALIAKLDPPGAVQDKGRAGAKSDPVSTLRNLALPFDLTFDLGASSLTWQKQKASGVRLSGSLIGRTLTLTSAGAEGWYGARFGIAGKIADLSTLEGIDLRLTGSATNAQSVLDALSLNAQSFPRPFGAAEVAAKVEGNAKDLRFAANMKALRGSAEATGALSGLLERAPIDSLNALTVRLTHPNLGDLMRMTRSGTSDDRSLDRPLDVYAKVDREADIYKILGLKANLGPMSVSGDLSLSTAGARPALSGKIQTGSIPLDSFTEAQGASPSSSQAGASTESVRWSRNAIDTGWMRAMDLDLGVRATRLRYKGWDLSDPSFTVTLRDGILSIPDLKSGLFNGTLDLATTVRSVADPRAPLSIDGKAAIADVGIEPLLHAFTSGLPMKARGNVSLNTTIAASGVSMAALVNDLSGKGDLSGKDIVLEGVDLPRFARALSSETKPGDTLEGFWKGATSGGSTRFDTLTGTYVIEEGVIRIGQLLLDGLQTSINTTGAVNLPRWTVDLKNRITLKEGKEAPPFDVTISGPLDNPANTFGAGVMQDYFARKLNRKIEGLIQDKLGAKLQDKLGLPDFKTPQQTEPATGGDPPATPEAPGSETPVQAPAPSAPKPEDLFKDVIRGLAR